MPPDSLEIMTNMTIFLSEVSQTECKRLLKSLQATRALWQQNIVAYILPLQKLWLQQMWSGSG